MKNNTILLKKLQYKLASISSVAWVFFGGLVVIFMVVFILISGALEEASYQTKNKKVVKKTNATVAEKKSQPWEKKAMAQEVKPLNVSKPKNTVTHNKPWEETQVSPYSKNDRLDITSVVKTQKLDKDKIKNIITSGKKTALSTCTLTQEYAHFVGKEIVYYRQIKIADGFAYTPAYELDNWDNKGIVLAKEFLVTALDKEHNMVEVKPKKWIPAYSFASCKMTKKAS